jgi:ribonucleotide monophosphatase NagD (HAD superfamily)
MPYLEKLISRSVPMYSANPDLKAVQPSGGIEYMPGVIAEKYEKMGGSVTWYGKPGREHFEACVKMIDLPKDKVCHVGDSLHHDVKGANNGGEAEAKVLYRLPTYLTSLPFVASLLAFRSSP